MLLSIFAAVLENLREYIVLFQKNMMIRASTFIKFCKHLHKFQKSKRLRLKAIIVLIFFHYRRSPIFFLKRTVWKMYLVQTEIVWLNAFKGLISSNCNPTAVQAHRLPTFP